MVFPKEKINKLINHNFMEFIYHQKGRKQNHDMTVLVINLKENTQIV